tara:strand:+ start:1021 stop:1446 length:426 start_codon:yes stop_codon:yes gene_type:complete
MRSPMQYLHAKRDELREALHTTSVREWIQEDFLLRTAVALEHLWPLFVHAWTVEATYTVRVHDPVKGTVETLNLTEPEIRNTYGDEVFVAAREQMKENPGVEALVNQAEVMFKSWDDIMETDGIQQWGDWTCRPEDDDDLH